MGNYELLKAAINEVIKANGRQEITGQVLNQVLLSMVNSLGAGYQCMGVATPSTDPGTPDQNVFYFATQAGTYTNFDAIVLQAGISVLIWDGDWASQTWFTVDNEPTAESNNLVKSGGIYNYAKKVLNSIVSTLYDRYGNKVTMTEITYDNGVYINTNGSYGTGALYAITNLIDIRGLGDITFTGKIIDIAIVPYVLFYDEHKEVIANSGLMAPNTSLFTNTFTPPEGAAFARFCTYCYNSIFTVTSEFSLNDDIAKKIGEYNNEINKLNDDVNTITTFVLDKNGDYIDLASITDSNGVYIGSNGELNYGSAYGISPRIDVQGLKTIYYTGYIVDKNVVAIAKFLNADMTVNSVVMSSSGNMPQNPSRVAMSVPDGARYVVCCTHKTSLRFVVASDKNGISLLRKECETEASVYQDKKVRTIKDNVIVSLKETCGFASIIHKWGFIGDSLSSGLFQWLEQGSEPQFTDYSYSWGQMLMAIIGHAKGTNFSVGGMTAAGWYQRYITNSTPAYNYEAVWTTFAEDLKQAYTIMLGTNDNNISVPVGNFATDVDLEDYTQNANTFCGNYAKIIQKIKELQPSAKIFVITIPTIFSSTAEQNGYNTIIRQMATEFSNVFLVDLYALIPNISSQLKDLFRIDGHGTSTGYQWIAYVMATLIDNVIENNLDSFKWVCRIGTQYDNGNL